VEIFLHSPVLLFFLIIFFKIIKFVVYCFWIIWSHWTRFLFRTATRIYWKILILMKYLKTPSPSSFPLCFKYFPENRICSEIVVLINLLHTWIEWTFKKDIIYHIHDDWWKEYVFHNQAQKRESVSHSPRHIAVSQKFRIVVSYQAGREIHKATCVTACDDELLSLFCVIFLKEISRFRMIGEEKKCFWFGANKILEHNIFREHYITQELLFFGLFLKLSGC